MSTVTHMEVEEEKVGPVEPINVLTGVFLKSVFLLSRTKFVLVGLFRNRGDGIGVLFTKEKDYVYWSHDTFNQFAVKFNEITVCLENKRNFFYKVDTGVDLQVSYVFGRLDVSLHDGEHTLTMNTTEWRQFISNLPLVYRCLRELFIYEDQLKRFIIDHIHSEDYVPTDVPVYLADRLFDEIQLYKHHESSSRISRIQK